MNFKTVNPVNFLYIPTHCTNVVLPVISFCGCGCLLHLSVCKRHMWPHNPAVGQKHFIGKTIPKTALWKRQWHRDIGFIWVVDIAQINPDGAVSMRFAYFLQDEIEIDALLPIDVGITESRQLFRVSSVNLHLHLKPKQVIVTANQTQHLILSGLVSAWTF